MNQPQRSENRQTEGGTTIIQFGHCQLFTNRRELIVDGVPVPLGNRAFDVLQMLVTAGGNLVTKDEILSRVWRGIVVEVDDYDDLTADEHRAISHGNAWTLFPRLVPKHDTASRNAAAHDRGGRTSA